MNIRKTYHLFLLFLALPAIADICGTEETRISNNAIVNYLLKNLRVTEVRVIEHVEDIRILLINMNERSSIEIPMTLEEIKPILFNINDEGLNERQSAEIKYLRLRSLNTKIYEDRSNTKSELIIQLLEVLMREKKLKFETL